VEKKYEILISIFFSAFAMLCNYEFAMGHMTAGSFPLVMVFNLIAIIFGLATLFSNK
tara:strand:+ start:171 stop:341 length:171 start_codon:yes stop_codon:yes gene_type:complete